MPELPNRNIPSPRNKPPQRDTPPKQIHPHPPLRHIKESTLPVGNKS